MKAAVVQINSTADRDRNLEVAERHVRAAAADGAVLVVLPEKWPLLVDGQELIDRSEAIDGETVAAARSWALSLGIHLQAGSFSERGAEGELPSNTALMISPEGEITAEYRKIHMFDVIAGGVEYRESSFEKAGDRLVVAEADRARIGMSICYDLRFPELFRSLLDLGADTYTVPSAFTAATGKPHWQPLLRARAIENQAFVLAANQVGEADPKFNSWGHSMIVDPWGEILSVLEAGEGFASADLDYGRLAEVRRQLPAVEHRRPALLRTEKKTA
jgi:predicted amidohydrolase